MEKERVKKLIEEVGEEYKAKIEEIRLATHSDSSELSKVNEALQYNAGYHAGAMSIIEKLLENNF